MRAVPRPLLGLAAALAALGVLALLVAGILAGLAPRGAEPSDSAAEPPAPSWAPPAPLPPGSSDPGPGIQNLADPEWVAEVAAATGIPPRALAAYASAAIWKASTMPECGIGWNTLAAIGATESDHGRHGGANIGEDGVASPLIFGVALDGGDTEEIADSDGGAIDGDAEFDRAVGPLQLIPQSWRNWHVDADGDGVENPHDIDDAAVATVNYLCRASTAMDTESGWRAAVGAFNSPEWYLARVAERGTAYAEAAASVGE